MTTFGVHSDDSMVGGLYNMIAVCGKGLNDAMVRKNLDAKYTREWFAENIMPEFSIGFNVANMNLWDLILSNGMINAMWNVDSVFYHNADIIKKYENEPNFKCLCMSNDDDAACKYFMPNLQKITLPLATTPEVWYSDNNERPRDVIFMATIQDPEETIAEAEAFIKDPELIAYYKKMYKYALKNPDKNMWEIANNCGLLSMLQNYDITKENQYSIYKLFMLKLSYVISYQKRIQLVQSLSDVNLEVYGGGPWEKYIKGKAEYKGILSINEAVKVLSETKIAINLQPLQILNGIHDRIMNSSVAGCMVFTDKNKMIYDNYGDSLGYFNPVDFRGFSNQVQFLLKNESTRLEKAKKAQQITLEKHTWDNRVEELLAL